MRRGQASLEYLTTYGWLFLVIIIGIGVISYFGLLEPSEFVSERCWMGAQLDCQDYKLERIDSSRTLMFIKVRNNFIEGIEVLEMNGTDPDFQLSGCVLPVVLPQGQLFQLECTINATMSRGTKYSVPMELTFRRNNTPFAPQHTLSGELYARVI